MAVQIVIFLAFTSVTLVFNTLLIWFAYKAFAGVTLRVTGAVQEAKESQLARQWIHALATASKQAVVVTETTKAKIHQFGPVLARAESTYGFGLATADVRIERLCDNVNRLSATAQKVVEMPSRTIGAAMEGVRAAIDDWTKPMSEQIDDDANPTPSQ